jgi:hypothetical protein
MRGGHLRAVLEIKDQHPIANKRLRNKWTHYDEVLDELYDRQGGGVQPQRFTTQDDFSERTDYSTIRLLAVDSLNFRYQGFGDFHLPTLFDAVEDVYRRVDLALHSWGERWQLPNPRG